MTFFCVGVVQGRKLHTLSSAEVDLVFIRAMKSNSSAHTGGYFHGRGSGHDKQLEYGEFYLACQLLAEELHTKAEQRRRRAIGAGRVEGARTRSAHRGVNGEVLTPLQVLVRQRLLPIAEAEGQRLRAGHLKLLELTGGLTDEQVLRDDRLQQLLAANTGVLVDIFRSYAQEGGALLRKAVVKQRRRATSRGRSRSRSPQVQFKPPNLYVRVQFTPANASRRDSDDEIAASVPDVRRYQGIGRRRSRDAARISLPLDIAGLTGHGVDAAGVASLTLTFNELLALCKDFDLVPAVVNMATLLDVFMVTKADLYSGAGFVDLVTLEEFIVILVRLAVRMPPPKEAAAAQRVVVTPMAMLLRLLGHMDTSGGLVAMTSHVRGGMGHAHHFSLHPPRASSSGSAGVRGPAQLRKASMESHHRSDDTGAGAGWGAGAGAGGGGSALRVDTAPPTRERRRPSRETRRGPRMEYQPPTLVQPSHTASSATRRATGSRSGTRHTARRTHRTQSPPTAGATLSGRRDRSDDAANRAISQRLLAKRAAHRQHARK